MDVQEIVKQWLKANGYDGLYRPGECACELADLMPCLEISRSCEAGYRTEGCDEECGMGCKFHIGPEKPVTKKDRCKHNGIEGECLICHAEEARRPATTQEVEEWGQAEREDLGAL